MSSREQSILDAIRLIRSANVGPITYHQLIALYGTAGKALEALPELAARGGGKRKIRIFSERDAAKELKEVKKAGAELLVSGDNNYPLHLAHIPDAPPVITYLGNIHLLEKTCVAIVGARNASAAGLKTARKLSGGLGERDYCIVSGMARGIDTIAHQAALEHGTIAVLAGGIDNIYPKENTDLYHRLCAEGLILAENPIGTKPLDRHFPRRNRIISGLSIGVIVAEASIGSGSLITARMAAEQNREVMVVPGSPEDPRCIGSNNLIKNGASLIQNVSDAVDILYPLRERMIEEPPEDKIFKNFEGDLKQSDRMKVVDLLGPTPSSIDELVTMSGLPVSVVHIILLELELAGLLIRSFRGVSLLERPPEPREI
ncbi:putative Rossmann fold nucleotide-binding protein involved in DNA uptake [alpha proteobacterium IMCC14465]|uniref:Putative Rossmann fold nucleotide-binding protein involved in DNA uptake n=1 Tax=alpha proteobacterium IMCC14465 TaxID=1220535 RepID=J9A2G9_9PROT|nr:putative Rossmann fold nucleotide-binding protein involved in DNA uptake [alpha proteobacterium IMCC14465]